MGLKDFFKKVGSLFKKGGTHAKSVKQYYRYGIRGRMINCPNCGRLVRDTELARQGGICSDCAENIRVAAAVPGFVPDIKRRGVRGETYKEHRGQRWVKNKPEDFKTCPVCQRQVNMKATNKCSCGYVFWEKTPLKHEAGLKIKTNIYEAFILVIAAMACFGIPPIFALSPFSYLAVGLIFAAGYVLFPSEGQVLASLEPGEPLLAKGSILLTKSILKIAAFGFIILQFWLTNRIIALILGFFFYFTMPLRYKTTRPWKMIEAWLRMGLGAYLAYVFWLTFGPGSAIASSLLWMGLAFFATLPVQVPGDEEDAKAVIKIELKGKLAGHAQGLEYVERFIFIIFMAIGLFAFIMPYGINLSDVNFLMFISVWGLALFVGIFAGPEARPPIGALVILVSLFVFAGAYTGVVGEAIFGVWWPQIYAFSETYLSPLGDAWSEAQSSLTDTWDILTNPMAYYAKMAEKQKAATSKVKTGGTKKSIEVTRFEFDTKILDPAFIPLLGYIDIENQGEFESNFTKVGLAAYWTNASMVGTAPGVQTSKVGIFDKIYCSDGVTGTGIGTNYAQCDWQQTMYSKQTKSLSFKMRSGEGGPWYTVEFPDGNIDLAETNTTDDGITYYIRGGQNLIFKANFTYNYNVNVSIPIQIINEDLYERMVQARQMMLGVVESQYTGGPAKATISTKIQPIVTGRQSLITLYIYNEGEGNITKVTNFTIIVPEVLGSGESIPIEAHTFTSCGNLNHYEDSKTYRATCEYDPSKTSNPTLYPPVTRGNYRKVSFFVTPRQITDQITTLIVAIASYEYTKEKTTNLQIATYPYQ